MVGLGDHRVGISALTGRPCDPDARPHNDAASSRDAHRLTLRLAQAVGELHRLLRTADVRAHGEELIATDAPDHVAVAYRVLQALSDDAQKFVAGSVALVITLRLRNN